MIAKWEYYCHACYQLRLFMREGYPEKCGNCESAEIEVDHVNSVHLTELRAENAHSV